MAKTIKLKTRLQKFIQYSDKYSDEEIGDHYETNNSGAKFIVNNKYS